MNKRDLILERAETLFVQKGVNAVTMDMIAQAVPASKMTIYKYFADKRALVEAVAVRLTDRAVAKVEEVIENSDSPEAAFRNLLIRETQSDLGFSDAFILDVMNGYPDLAARLIEQGRQGTYRLIEELIFRGQGDGFIRKDVSPHVIVLFMSAIKEFFSQPGTMQTVPDLNALAEQVRTMFLHGILVQR